MIHANRRLSLCQASYFLNFEVLSTAVQTVIPVPQWAEDTGTSNGKVQKKSAMFVIYKLLSSKRYFLMPTATIGTTGTSSTTSLYHVISISV